MPTSPFLTILRQMEWTDQEGIWFLWRVRWKPSIVLYGRDVGVCMACVSVREDKWGGICPGSSYYRSSTKRENWSQTNHDNYYEGKVQVVQGLMNNNQSPKMSLGVYLKSLDYWADRTCFNPRPYIDLASIRCERYTARHSVFLHQRQKYEYHVHNQIKSSIDHPDAPTNSQHRMKTGMDIRAEGNYRCVATASTNFLFCVSASMGEHCYWYFFNGLFIG